VAITLDRQHMKDYILYLSLMVVGACMYNVWAYIKYLEHSNVVLTNLIKEKIHNADLATRERDA